jgi:glutamine amidotransferase
MFFLALTFGLEDDVIAGVERMVGFVEGVGRENGIAHPMQMTLAVMDGHTLYAFRYSSEGRSRTLFHSASIETLREHFPNVRTFSDDARAVVSEPLGAVENASRIWVEVPESSALIVSGGAVDVLPLRPRSALAA